jgi:hypothetical protein
MSKGANKTLDPLDSLECTIAFDVMDWSEGKRHAWIYGIVFGWDNKSFKEFEDKEYWGRPASKRLKKLHKNFLKLKKESKQYE